MKKLKNLFLKFIHKTWSEKITYVVYFMFFVFMSLVFLYPIYSAILTSVTDVGNTIRGEGARFIDYFIVKGKPQGETWAGVIESFSVMTDAGDQNLLAMLFNSIWFTVAKVSLSLLASTVLAYAVAKYNFPGKRLIYLLAIFVQTIPIFGTGAASIKLFIGLNMMNNPLLFWIAWITGFDFTFIIMHGAFTGISNSPSSSIRSTFAMSRKPWSRTVCQCCSNDARLPPYAVLHSTIVPFTSFTSLPMSEGCRKLCPPGSPVLIFTATRPLAFTPSAS